MCEPVRFGRVSGGVVRGLDRVHISLLCCLLGNWPKGPRPSSLVRLTNDPLVYLCTIDYMYGHRHRDNQFCSGPGAHQILSYPSFNLQQARSVQLPSSSQRYTGQRPTATPDSTPCAYRRLKPTPDLLCFLQSLEPTNDCVGSSLNSAPLYRA